MDLRDPLSSVSHLLTGFWAIFATLMLFRYAPPIRSRRIAAVVYGLSMVALYFASGLFHAIQFDGDLDQFRFFQKLDQSAILILIAGTNTPVMVCVLEGAWRRWCLRMMWGIAVVGVATLWLLPKPPHWIIVANCLGMGWLGFLPFAQYYRALGWRVMNWVWAGAFAYTGGAVVELVNWPVISLGPIHIGYHDVFHLCDSVASILFYLLILRYVIRYQKPARLPTRSASTPIANIAA